MTAALKAAIGNDNVIDKPPTMGGEDFSEFSLPDHSIPAFMFNVGAVDPAKMADSKKRAHSCPRCTRASSCPSRSRPSAPA